MTSKTTWMQQWHAGIQSWNNSNHEEVGNQWKFDRIFRENKIALVLSSLIMDMIMIEMKTNFWQIVWQPRRREKFALVLTALNMIKIMVGKEECWQTKTEKK